MVNRWIIVSLLCWCGVAAKGQPESEKMSIDQRIVRANERKMKKKREVTVHEKVKAVKKQDRKSRRKKQPLVKRRK